MKADAFVPHSKNGHIIPLQEHIAKVMKVSAQVPFMNKSMKTVI